MDASIIIVTKNTGGNFKPLLQRIFSQEFSGGYEVLVIDSGSVDDTIDTAQQFPVKLTQISPGEFHHGKTRNLGAQLSGGEVLVYITQDALPLSNNWLQKLVGNFEDPSVAMVCGRQIPWQATKPPEKFFYFYNFPQFRIRVASGTSDYYHDNIFISNVNSAIRKDIWEKFKFSEAVVMAEDKEFAKRILADGWTIIYEPEAAVYHANDFGLWAAFCRSVDFGIALSQGAGGLPRSKNWVLRKLKYPLEEARYIVANKGWWKWLPYSIAYEPCKQLGIVVGWAKGKFA